MERTRGSGIDFVHRHFGTGRKYIVEISSGSAALLDFDGDGRLDVFFGQGAPLPGHVGAATDHRDRLYRNLGDFRFEDVTEQSGAFDLEYTLSAAAPDLDGDGDPDLLLCNLGPDRLLRNDSGSFVDVTETSGILADDYSSAAAFADFDRDGDLDLFIAQYVLEVFDHEGCGDRSKGREWVSYCSPDEYPAAHDRLFRNDDGTFTDVTEAAGIVDVDGKGLGLVISDYDFDGDADLFVANDSTPNQLWCNQGGFCFRDVAAVVGVAVGLNGMSQACMGTDFADVDGDGDFDLVAANLALEGLTLYQYDGRSMFDDKSISSGLQRPSLLYVGFGAELFDVENDGDIDLLVVNGHVVDNIERSDPAQTFSQPAQLFLNDGTGRFSVALEEAGPYFRERHVSRALAVGDLDNDGDLDAVIGDNNGPPHLLENRAGHRRSWIGLELIGKARNRSALGALVRVRAGGRTHVNEVRGTSSFAAFHDLRLLFGLGDLESVDQVEVRWPDGEVQTCEHLPARRYHRITQQ